MWLLCPSYLFTLWNVSDSVGIYNFTGPLDKGIGRTQSVVPILPAPSPVSSQPATALLITTSTPVTMGQSVAHSPSQVCILLPIFIPAALDYCLYMVLLYPCKISLIAWGIFNVHDISGVVCSLSFRSDRYIYVTDITVVEFSPGTLEGWIFECVV